MGELDYVKCYKCNMGFAYYSKGYADIPLPLCNILGSENIPSLEGRGQRGGDRGEGEYIQSPPPNLPPQGGG
jgi:hypothetical protein